MTPQQIAVIILRVCSIFLLFQALITIEQGRELVKLAADGSFYTQIIFLTYLALAAVCWFFPVQLANKLIPSTTLKNTINLEPHQAILAICVGIGLWMICIEVIPIMSRYFAVIIIVSQHGASITEASASEHLSFLVGVIQFILGLILIFRASDVSRKIIELNSRDS
ncbi:MAG: hypothetical protein Q7T42_06765 [Methylotenera sp.]|uniref:hypothetical protein n=1 Tax=Methylotenera sp. TaxID=2051956 RepID=UPI0027181A1E|nr:hypothetical protein [Methylotenera sp.]MDO9206507.1 hypothetical protein [Methylotenera sp.]MDO9393654.1 hypothetical protein [Methylotenera sp.]MDP1521914.1 hypothetical protein [Methylotenera sp.]MDP2231613.1 hypothetical protein [Methylotenera sp.]